MKCPPRGETEFRVLLLLESPGLCGLAADIPCRHGDPALRARDPELSDPFPAHRREYEADGLDIADLDPDPVAQFRGWYEDAVAAGEVEPEAMLLATVSPAGQPSGRFVLLRGVSAEGFVFFTNYESAKSRDLESNPACALVFGWLALHRSVRIEGIASRLGASACDAYFASRPRESQLGAWASPQSAVLGSRMELDACMADVSERFGAGEPVPRPPHWGGWMVAPSRVEFWQGRRSRLHDRLRYRRSEEDGWVVERLAP